MELKIQFDCDNDAFADDNLHEETADILKRIEKDVRHAAISGDAIRDTNGNTIGRWSLSADNE